MKSTREQLLEAVTELDEWALRDGYRVGADLITSRESHAKHKAAYHRLVKLIEQVTEGTPC